MLTSKICYYLFGIKPLIISAVVLLLLAFGRQIEKLFDNKFFRIFLVSFPVVIIFIRILRNDPFFLSDDFAHLSFVYNNSYLGILKIVLSKPGIWVGHHMIFGFWLFKFVYNIFGTNIYPYVSVIFLLNLTSTLVFYVMSGEFIKNNCIRTVVAFLFGFLYLSWISNIHELLGAIFLILCFYAFIRWIKSKSENTLFGFWAILLYILAVFSKEITFLIFPFLCLIFLYIRKSRIEKKDRKVLIPFFLTFMIYSVFYASTFLGYFGQNSGYKMGFDLSRIFFNLTFYLKFVLPGIGSYFNLILITLLALYAYTVYRKNYWPIIFLLGFLIFIFPVLLFSDRVSSYYVYIPAIFLFLSFGVISEFVYQKIIEFRIKPLVKKLILAIAIVLIVLFVFTIDRGLMDNCFLVFAPWSNQTRQQFLSLISSVKSFESNEQKSARFVLDAKSRELITDNGIDVIRPFLDKHKDILYEYTYDGVHNVLIVNKK